MIGIYKITSKNNRIYIGQSVDIQRRFNAYKILNCKAQVRLYNSFLKYGIDNHKFEIIEECNIEFLNDRERYWQDYFECIGKNGLNCKLTNTKDKSGKLSEKMISDMSQRQKGNKHWLGKKHSENTKLKMSKNNLGKVFSHETKLKMSESAKIKTFTDSHRLNMSISKKGTKQDFEHLHKRTFCRRKIILDTNTGVFYFGSKEASLYYGINKHTLDSMLINQNTNRTSLIHV